jgi:hypothetical protein
MQAGGLCGGCFHRLHRHLPWGFGAYSKKEITNFFVVFRLEGEAAVAIAILHHHLSWGLGDYSIREKK